MEVAMQRPEVPQPEKGSIRKFFSNVVRPRAKRGVVVVKTSEAVSTRDSSAGVSDSLRAQPAPHRDEGCPPNVAITDGTKEVHSGSFSGDFEASGDAWMDEWNCPISKLPMAEPVLVSSGITYECKVIEIYFELGHSQCFVTGTELQPNVIIPNMALKTTIGNWCHSRNISRPVPPSPDAAKSAVDRACGFRKAFVSDTPSSSASSGRRSISSRSGEHPSEHLPISLQSKDVICSAETSDDNQEVPSGICSSSKNPSGRLHSSEIETPPMRYMHSSTVIIGPRKDDHTQSPRAAVPLPLSTTPSSYDAELLSEGRNGGNRNSAGIDGRLDDETVHRLIQGLKHTQIMEQEQAAMEIRRLTRISSQNRLDLCQPDVLNALGNLLQSRYSMVQVNIVASVMNISLESDNKLKVARAGAIPALIDVLKSGASEAQEHAAGAIFSLALNDDNKLAIGVLGAIPPLIHVLRSEQHGARRDAAMALYHLSFSPLNRSKLIRAGGVAIFLGIAHDERSDVVSRVLLILCNIAATQEGRAAIGEKHGIPVLAGLLTRDDEVVRGEERTVNWAEVREHAAATLLQLSPHSGRAKSQVLEQPGILEALQRLAENGTPRAREKAVALLSIFRGHPERSQTGSSDNHGFAYRRSYLRNAGNGEKAESAVF